MAPLLIEKRSLFVYMFSTVCIMCAVFVSGYFIGYNTAENVEQGHEIVELNIPDVAPTMLTELDPVVPESVAPGEHIDVDLPDDQSGTTVLSENMAVESPVQQDGVASQELAAAGKGSPETAVVDAPKPEADAVQEQNVAVGGPLEPVVEDPLDILADTADESSANYTIQVGLFSSEDNAERKVEDLLAKQVSAYRTQFTDRKARLLHNVRFGYFADRESAKRALETYRTAMLGDGYLVRIKR